MKSTSTVQLRKLLAIAISTLLLPVAAQAATMSFGPTPYLQADSSSQDTPAGFFDFTSPGFKTAWIEDFEPDNVTPAPDAFLTITSDSGNGEILGPGALSPSGSGAFVTDSVDGDDGAVDGSGTGGHSWFANGANEITVSFMNGVRAAGLVFTDGDSSSTKITLEAFDTLGASLGLIDAGDLAGPFNTGQTDEDRFLGFNDDMTNIGSIKLVMTGGDGIEIDHVHWQEPVPEPGAQFLALFATLGLIGLRRGRK